MDNKFQAAIGASGAILPANRAEQFKRLYSQTSPAEREALYAVARYAYTGEGMIFDIGTAAGGSTYCLAAGVLDSNLKGKRCRVHGFDIFAGFALEAFAERLKSEGRAFGSDREFFAWHTGEVSEAIMYTPADLVAEPQVLQYPEKIEIAHIDAAKNLPLWKAIFPAIASRVIPNKTIWIFQDFEVICLPWHVYALGELLPFGDIIGGAPYATVYFKFSKAIPAHIAAKIAADDFSLAEKLARVDQVYEIVDRNFSYLFPGALAINDFRLATKAFCHDMTGARDDARAIASDLAPAFRAHPGMKAHLARFGLDERSI